MPPYDRIVIGASAGGVEALKELVSQLPPSLEAAVFIVLHTPANSESALPNILNRINSIKSSHAVDGEPIEEGHIYIAPPGWHMLLRGEKISLTKGPRENGVRPSIDVLFRSAADSYGSRVIGILLSGALDDGTAGLQKIKQNGGLALVQSPKEALFSGMPLSAINRFEVDEVLQISQIATQLSDLVNNQSDNGNEKVSLPEYFDDQKQFVLRDKASFQEGIEDATHRTILTCPDCGGVLWELKDKNVIQYQCHVGHNYSIESLIDRQGEALEGALWTTVRALEERASLYERIANQAKGHPDGRIRERFLERTAYAKQQARIIRQILENDNS